MLSEIVNRRSIRRYKPDPVSDSDIKKLIRAAQFAPNGRHLRAWEFVVVKDFYTRKKISEIGGEDVILEAPVTIIIAVNQNKTDLGVQDIAVASENIFLEATKMGLGTVWKNLDKKTAEEVKKILKIPVNFLVINCIPVGYPAENPGPHTDEDFEEKKIHREKF